MHKYAAGFKVEFKKASFTVKLGKLNYLVLCKG